MVKISPTFAGAAGAERMLAFSYAGADQRQALAALFALDDMLGGILRTTREPIVGQMRLTWWHEALGALDGGAPPAEPILQALARHVLPHGVSGARLAGMVDAWEALLDGDVPDDDALDTHAQRGVVLFGAAATLLGAAPRDPVAPAGRGWALADLARNVSDAVVAERARLLARGPLEAAAAARWSRPARTLGALAHLARMDLAVPPGVPIRIGAPPRVWRVLRHRLTGR